MTTFLTTAQRDFLIEEYKEQLIEFDLLEEDGYLLEELKGLNNVNFWNAICDFMPGYAEPGMLARAMKGQA